MTASLFDWLLVLLVFGVPLVIGALLVFTARFVPTKWVRVFLSVLGVGLISSELCYMMINAPYLWAVHLEQRWSAANPKTKAQLESYLSLYSQHEIQPYQSEWGSHHPLRPGDRMIQYLLLWRAPLDVVYDSNDVIVQIYTSYE